MDLRFSPEDEAFRHEVRSWFELNLVGEFAEFGGRGGPGDEHEGFEVRLAWERKMADGGWTCVGWPKEHGGRGATLQQQVIFHEEYARADAPARVGIVGEGLLGPTLIAHGTDEQQRRFLPGIVRVEELWCQGYSEPNAGSDLANVQTKAVLDGDEWVITGQKVWTSLAHWADWCFVLCRTDAEAPKHKGLSYILCPMDQPGVEIRPIVQLTGTSEFNEVFFDGARARGDDVVGDVNGGWKVALSTLAFERGVATLGQQLTFDREYRGILAMAAASGRTGDRVLRQRLAQAWMELRIMRFNALRSLTAADDGGVGPESSFAKLYWATFHQRLGELAIDVAGPAGVVADRPPYELSAWQRLFLFSRADTIYGGSNEIQRNIIGERALGLPPEPRPDRA